MKTLNQRALYAVLLSLLMTIAAQAHIKWFVEYNISNYPKSIWSVVTESYFIALLILSTVVMAISFIIDDKISPVYKLNKVSNMLSQYGSLFMRIMFALSFLSLGFIYPDRTLTPELISDHGYVQYANIIIAILILFRKTSALGAIGVGVLYFQSIYEYGLFHMIDYVVYLGIVVFFVFDSIVGDKYQAQLIQMLRVLISFSFLWGAVDKFTHPNLYYDLISQTPYIVFGFNQTFFVQTAGFVELCLAYLILSGRTAAKVAGAGLIGIVLVAIIPFGLIDAVGHMVFAMVLIAVTALPNPYECQHKPVIKTVGYLLAIVCVFGLYYGAFYGLGTHLCDAEAHHAHYQCQVRTHHIPVFP